MYSGNPFCGNRLKRNKKVLLRCHFYSKSAYREDRMSCHSSQSYIKKNIGAVFIIKSFNVCNCVSTYSSIETYLKSYQFLPFI